MTRVPRSFFVPGKLPGQNELIASAKGFAGNGFGYAKLKRKWTDDIALLVKAAKLGYAKSPVHLSFTWREKDRRRDPDNVAGGGRKLVLDGLVRAGVIGGDGWGFVAGWSDTFEISARPGVLVEMRLKEQ